MTTIGSARHDERGKYSGGKPGDQDGTEVSTQEFYWHPKGWRVFRAIDPNVAAKQAEAMEAACGNNNIGYCQAHRNDLYKQAKPLGFRLDLVKTPTETDCSALVRCCMAYAGVMVGDFDTSGEASLIISSKAYKEVFIKSAADVKPGDILVTKTKGHTAIAVQGKYTAVTQPAKLGWIQAGKDWYYRTAPGMNAHGWKNIKNADGETRRYYFDEKGKMLAGWQKILNDWYYFQPDGDLAGSMYVSNSLGAQYIWNL